MVATTWARTIPLPGSWPRRVRSAVVHAISLAGASMAATRGWASNSMNPALRRQSEIDRLQQEARLLREEIRIKDARMHHIEAQKRPHYPPTERLAILELRAARSWSLAQTARTFLVTPLSIASWTARLGGLTPDEVYHHRRPAVRAPCFEPRPLWPRRSPCASPRTLIRGRPGVQLDIDVCYLDGRRHLPIVTLKRAA